MRKRRGKRRRSRRKMTAKLREDALRRRWRKSESLPRWRRKRPLKVQPKGRRPPMPLHLKVESIRSFLPTLWVHGKATTTKWTSKTGGYLSALERKELHLTLPSSRPSYVLLKGQSYQGAGKRRAPKRDIHVDQVYLTVPGQVLLSAETKFKVVSGSKYGIIGRNGLGKSVLMTRLSRREEPFQHIPEYINILHVEQEIQGDDRFPLQAVLESNREREWLLAEEKRFNEAEKDEQLAHVMSMKSYDQTDIFERLREIESHKAEARASRILYGLGFSNEEITRKKTREYSGGKRRITLYGIVGSPCL